MRYLSLFSGIGGFDLGLDRAGHRCVGQVEIDKDCNRVLAHHWPDVTRYQDVTKYHGKAGAAELVCGGFPCQDLSVAGKRAGLAGKRSGLWGEFRRVIAEVAPAWVLIENVPGLLSSNGGRDMGTILGRLAELGYWWAYRILDLQYFRVPQRRRRVFIVGCLANRAGAATVLFEPESCDGDSAPGREAGEDVAASLGGGAAGRGWSDDTDRAGAFVPEVYGGNDQRGPRAAAAAAVNAGGQRRQDFETENFVIAGTLQSHKQRHGHAMSTQQAAESGQLVSCTIPASDGGVNDYTPLTTHTLKAEGHDASEDGTGRGVPLVYNPHRTLQKDGSVAEGFKPDQIVDALHGPTGNKEPMVFQTRIARNGRGQPSDMAHNLTSCEGGTHADSKPHIAYAGGIRRLTPLECLRLQSFPDDWLDIDPPLSDSAKYRMCGNAVAAVVAQWIGERIMACDLTGRVAGQRKE